MLRRNCDIMSRIYVKNPYFGGKKLGTANAIIYIMKYSLINNGFGSSWLSDFFDVNASQFNVDRNNSFSARSNIEETDDGYTITLEVPGMTKKDINITIENKVIKINGSKKINDTMNSVIKKEFAANINVDPKASSAKVENGILTVNLIKSKDTSNTIKIE